MPHRKIPKAVRGDEQPNREHEAEERGLLVNASEQRARGEGRDERDRHDERQDGAHPAAVNRHGVAPRLVERVKQFRDVVNFY